MNLLEKILIIPIIGIVVIALTNMDTKEGKIRGKQIGLITSILTLLGTIQM